MCGIVCFFGRADGVGRVLEALHLLEYRAPDSTGLATLAGENGKLAVRRSVGSPERLTATMVSRPLHALPAAGRAAGALLKQNPGFDLQTLRDCSPAAGNTLQHLYKPDGLRIGVGDRGSLGESAAQTRPECRFSARLCQTLEATGALSSPDFDQDPVRHAFRLVAAHVASRAAWDRNWKEALDEALLARAPAGAYADWRAAWEDEFAANVPGLAFAVAVRRFQETFPELADCLDEDDRERVGGLTAQALAQVVLGHGRWAMVGRVSETNAQPLCDRSGTRAVCENGAHNALAMLRLRAEQEAWWRARGLSGEEPVHRSENTTEIIVYEWERAFHQLSTDGLSEDELQFKAGLEAWGITDPEEQALRLTLRRVNVGNTHACVFYSCRAPGVLYVSSHRKAIAIVMRTVGSGRCELMVASDVNAALALWPGHKLDAAAARIRELQDAINRGGKGKRKARRALRALHRRFSVDVIFLDADLWQGEELLVRISSRIEAGQVAPRVQVSRYDGTPLAASPQRVRLDPALSSYGGYPSYTECHIAEIPAVLDGILTGYFRKGQVRLNSVWRKGTLLSPGLNTTVLRRRYGARLQRLRRVLLIGEGSLRCALQAAAPLLRESLPDVVVIVYRPVELLNLGETVDPAGDLAVEVSWSGATDAVLKVDDLLAELELLRLGVTGRPQGDLGRRTAGSAGTLDVRSGIEVSVASVKSYVASLTTLNLLALQLARIRGGLAHEANLREVIDELTLVLPERVHAAVEDQNRRERIRNVAARCRHFNKVAVVGSSPAVLAADLEIGKLAQIVTNTFEYHSTTLRPLIEHGALVDDDRQRTLFIVNATTTEQCRAARPVINYLSVLDIFFIIHTTPHAEIAAWEALPTAEVFVSPGVSGLLQPLIDALFYLDFAVALAYARGLSPREIDGPRNLAKAVTATAAERRVEAEARQDFHNVALAEFGAGRQARAAWDSSREMPSRETLRATAALRTAVAVISEPLPENLALDQPEHLIVVADTEATENAAVMASAAWESLLDIDLVVYRRFISELPDVSPDIALLRLIRAGAILSVRGPHTVALPADMLPLQWELLGASYLIGLAVRLARQRGGDTALWEIGLARMPLLIAETLTDVRLARQVETALAPCVAAGYDKVQIIGGGQDFASARSIARSLRTEGYMAVALYTDSAAHGPLAAVGGPDADHDTLIVILATDPLFQTAALADTQVYRARNAPALLVVPEGNQDLPAVRGVEAATILTVPAVPRAFTPLVNAALGATLARAMARLWEQREEEK